MRGNIFVLSKYALKFYDIYNPALRWLRKKKIEHEERMIKQI